MSSAESWSTTAANNNASPPDGFPEGMAPAALNNSSREVMAALAVLLRQFPWLKLSTGQTVVRNSATEFQLSSVDLTSIYTVGRRVREIGATTVLGYIATSSFSGGHTVVTVTNDAAAAIPTSLTAVDVAVDTANTVGTSAVLNAGTSAANVPRVSDLLGKHTFEVNANAMDLDFTNPPTATGLQQPGGTGTPAFSGLAFADGAVKQAFFDVTMPESYDGGAIEASLEWTANSTSTNSVVWQIGWVKASDNGSLSAAISTTGSVTDANGSSAYTRRQTSFVSIGNGGAATSGQVMGLFRVQRTGTDGSDNLAADAILKKIVFRYTIDSLNDS